MIPEVWLQGKQITGYASDAAPVLAGLTLEWGASNDIEHQEPAQLDFSILFLDGVMDQADFRRGAELEITYNQRTVFAGLIRSANALAGPKGLTVTGKCIEHLADLDGTYLQTEWLFETSKVRWQTLRTAFDGKGWELLPRARSHPYHEATTYYSSIKLMTLLERYIAANGNTTRWDTSERVDGVLKRSITSGVRGASTGSNRLETDGPTWIVEYSTSTNTGVITWLEANNVLRNAWTLEPGTAINSVNLSTQETKTDDDGKQVTDLVQSVRNNTASIARDGTNAVEVTASAFDPDVDWKTGIADTWFRPDTGWVLDEAQIRNSNEITLARLMRLLDTKIRTQNLVIIRGIRDHTPHQGAGNLRASLIGGTYTWTGKKWDLSLKLGRNQDFTAPNQWTFADVAASNVASIVQGTAATIGNQISFADFKQISKD